MKVLYWSEQFFPDIGGVEILSSDLITYLCQQGHQFCVITSNKVRKSDLPDSTNTNLSVHRFPFRKILDDHDLKRMKDLITIICEIIVKFNPNILHVNTQSPSIFFFERIIRMSKIKDIPILYSLHSPLNPIFHPEITINSESIITKVLSKAQRITAVSESLMKDFLAVFPEISHKAELVYNGLYIPDAIPETITFSPPKLLCLGRIVPHKGFDLAIKAMPSILKKIPDCQLIIAGGGPEMPALVDLVEALEISNQVKFLGWVEKDKVAALLNSVSIILMPSRWNEPFGLVALQAAQMARPIVATRDGGIPEIVVDNETGLLIERDDQQGLVSSVIHLLEHPQIAENMGLAARRRSIEIFSLDRCASTFSRIYQQLDGEGFP
ncbi:MAG: glycosyltransferase family 4 protein [Cyanobacteriota bacterium]|nr:glycosyltransferase family 4 protein [Cyanobacteriota bacterium]